MMDNTSTRRDDVPFSPAAGGPNSRLCSPQTAIKPTYGAAFRCIGPACEDTCCGGWSIPLDKRTYEAYKRFPPGKLGTVVEQSVAVAPPEEASASRFAVIQKSPSGYCPFFGPDQLCGIQQEYGPTLLSATCSMYPRALNRVHGNLEASLMLSCPEAARNVLLTPDFLELTADPLSGEFRTDTTIGLADQDSSPVKKPYAFFNETRALLIEIVLSRSLPLWQRLMLIGSLCKDLDALRAQDYSALVPGVLAAHRSALGHDALRQQLEQIPSQLGVKLRVFLKLTETRIQDEDCGTRFRDVFWSFVDGIGCVSGEPSEEVLRLYGEADASYYGPYLAARPHILENYLLNYIFQNLFPFGRRNTVRFETLTIFDDFLLLAMQFSWIETLLIGVSGLHKQAFAEEHVVHVIQSFCRTVEHNQFVLSSMLELIRHLQLNSMQGMAVMLKN